MGVSGAYEANRNRLHHSPEQVPPADPHRSSYWKDRPSAVIVLRDRVAVARRSNREITTVPTKGAIGTVFTFDQFVSSICHALDGRLVRDWSTGHDEYWEKLGHFAIGWKACEKLAAKL